MRTQVDRKINLKHVIYYLVYMFKVEMSARLCEFLFFFSGAQTKCKILLSYGSYLSSSCLSYFVIRTTDISPYNMGSNYLQGNLYWYIYAEHITIKLYYNNCDRLSFFLCTHPTGGLRFF